MPLPVARTPREEHLYIDIRPCRCGEPELPMSSSAVLFYAGGFASRFEGTCPGCGALRIFTFRSPDLEPGELPPAGYGGPEPSQLIDPGEWLICAALMAEEGDTVEAALMAEEAGKFVPPGGHGLTDEVFVSAAGKEAYQMLPEAFRLAAIAERAAAYRAGRLIGDESRLPGLSLDDPASLGRSAMREALMQRLRRFFETKDPAGLLQLDTEVELVALLGPGQAGAVVDELPAGLVRWFRFSARPPGQGRHELAEALRHFDAYRTGEIARPTDLPSPVRLLLDHCDVG